MSSRHKRSRVSSPAHSAVITSARRASCVPLEQHDLRLLENFVTSARNRGSNRECRVRLGSGSAGLPILPSPRVLGAHPETAVKQRVSVNPQPPLDILPTCYFHVHQQMPPPPSLSISASLSLSLCQSSPKTAAPSAHTPAAASLTWHQVIAPRDGSGGQELRSPPPPQTPLLNWPTHAPSPLYGFSYLSTPNAGSPAPSQEDWVLLPRPPDRKSVV